MTLEFLITTLIIVVSPGTGVLYTLATGLSRGARASVVAAFGCTRENWNKLSLTATGISLAAWKLDRVGSIKYYWRLRFAQNS